MTYRQLGHTDLVQLLQQGKIQAAGVSNFSADLMAEAEKTLCLTA